MSLIIGILALANILVGILFFFSAEFFAEAGLFSSDLADSFFIFLALLYCAKGVILFYVLDWKRWAVYAYSGGVALSVIANLSVGSSASEVITIEVLVYAYIAYQSWRSWHCFD